MFDVLNYWERRYQNGIGSGAGSRDLAAIRKARSINNLIVAHGVESVVDWGCGDGEIASRIVVPHYIGLEVSETALELCKALADGPGREWYLYDGFVAPEVHGDLALSLDIIFHLVEDDLYQRHIAMVFESAPLVCIASSNRNEAGWPHVLHRKFLNDVPPEFEVLGKSRHTSQIGMWVFKRSA